MNENIEKNHELKLVSRNFLEVTGIHKIISFDSKEFVVESNMGLIHINGDGLELLALDNSIGLLKIKGKINGYNYIDRLTKNKKESFLVKLFK